MFPHGETITRTRDVYGEQTDPYGNPAPTGVDTKVFHGVAVGPRSETPTAEEVRTGRQAVVIGLNLWLKDPDADIDARDRVTCRGKEYEVDGEVARYHHPMTGRPGGCVVNLKRVEG